MSEQRIAELEQFIFDRAKEYGELLKRYATLEDQLDAALRRCDKFLAKWEASVTTSERLMTKLEAAHGVHR